MATRPIIITLSQKSVENAIKRVQQYQLRFQRKLRKFVKELANVGIAVVDTNMAEAQYTFDGKIRSGSDTSHNAYVELNSNGSTAEAKLIVQGKELLFIEFGAGVYYNGAAGASPHPKGEEFGFLIGSYGKGNGQKKVWGYYNENNQLVLTRGVKATMPVLKAEQKIIEDYKNVVKKVFG